MRREVEDGMRKIRRTVVDIRIERLLFVRSRASPRSSWCERCGCAVEFVTLAAASSISGMSEDDVLRLLPDEIHTLDSRNAPLICLPSLLGGRQSSIDSINQF
jgi:hypothetical protein